MTKNISLIQPKKEIRENWNNSVDRSNWCKEYSWAIPTESVIERLGDFSPLIEIGAGTGYWAKLIQQSGGEVFPFDQFLGRRNNYNHTKTWTKINQGGPGMLKDLGKEFNLFLCWPPYAEPMALHCLKLFQGDYIIYIGEGFGGCTGCDEFHSLLEKQFSLIQEINIPQWYGIHDLLFIYKRN